MTELSEAHHRIVDTLDRARELPPIERVVHVQMLLDRLPESLVGERRERFIAGVWEYVGLPLPGETS